MFKLFAYWLIVGSAVVIIYSDVVTFEGALQENQTAIAISLALALFSWLALWRSDPGIIDHRTASLYAGGHYYDYDELMYHPKRVCRTTGLVKPARSKFCKEIGTNVARFDHYCPWVGVAVGEANYALYLGVLLTHWVLAAHTMLLSASRLSSIAESRGLWETSYNQQQQGGGSSSDHARSAAGLQDYPLVQVGIRLLISNPRLCFLLIVAAVGFLPLVTCLLAFHVHLIWRGLTTNEFYKLRDAHRFHAALRDATSEVCVWLAGVCSRWLV
jgi:palmitoyltransferase